MFSYLFRRISNLKRKQVVPAVTEAGPVEDAADNNNKVATGTEDAPAPGPSVTVNVQNVTTAMAGAAAKNKAFYSGAAPTPKKAWGKATQKKKMMTWVQSWQRL